MSVHDVATSERTGGTAAVLITTCANARLAGPGAPMECGGSTPLWTGRLDGPPRPCLSHYLLSNISSPRCVEPHRSRSAGRRRAATLHNGFLVSARDGRK